MNRKNIPETNSNQPLTIYFDYTCPYCYRGFLDLLDLLTDAPPDIRWMPCEAHPLPEYAHTHSSLASQAMMAAAACGADLLQFHQAVYDAHFHGMQRIDDIHLLVSIAKACGADGHETALALEDRRYEKAVRDNNTLVWETMRLASVPCYQRSDKLLTSPEDVMIPKQRLKDFLGVR